MATAQEWCIACNLSDDIACSSKSCREAWRGLLGSSALAICQFSKGGLTILQAQELEKDTFVEVSMSAVRWHHAMRNLHRRVHHVGHFTDVHDSSSMEFDFTGVAASETCKGDVRCTSVTQQGPCLPLSRVYSETQDLPCMSNRNTCLLQVMLEAQCPTAESVLSQSLFHLSKATLSYFSFKKMAAEAQHGRCQCAIQRTTSLSIPECLQALCLSAVGASLLL